LEISIQNTDRADPVPYGKTLREALEIIKPEQLLVYGGNPSIEVFKASGWKGDTIHCMNYAGVRRGVTYDKKAGAAKLTKKQRDEIITKHGGDPKKPVGRRRLAKVVPDDVDDDE
jgi:hypothetical protein